MLNLSETINNKFDELIQRHILSTKKEEDISKSIIQLESASFILQQLQKSTMIETKPKRPLCQYTACTKYVSLGGKLPFCRSHGGDGRRCMYIGCVRRCRAKGTQLCVTHGGGERCGFENCSKPVQYGGELRRCKAHGGGKRCEYDGCVKSRQSGKLPFCKSHGGGIRCSVLECDKAARSGNTTLCIKHGGGIRCIIKGCEKAARTKRLPYCIKHHSQ